jgi:hypothetical protein
VPSSCFGRHGRGSAGIVRRAGPGLTVMARDRWRRGAAADSIPDLLRRLRPEIESLLASYGLDETEAAAVLGEILRVLMYRWDRIDSRELWLLATLHRGCQRQLRRRALSTD